MDILNFIQKVLIDEFKKIQQDEGHHYISFGLISQGIEFLGACLDSDPFSKEGLSGPRFRKAICNLFPKPYHQFNQGKGRAFDLYDNLRCGFSHILLPKRQLELIGRSEITKFQANHLEVKKIRGVDRLILVSEDLFEDYEKACSEIISRINDGRLSGSKYAGEVLLTEP